MRFTILFLFCVGTLAVPALVILALFFLGPDPYGWSQDPGGLLKNGRGAELFAEAKVTVQEDRLTATFAEGPRVELRLLEDEQAAGEAAAEARADIQKEGGRTTKSPFDFTYRVGDPARCGRILPVGRALIHVTAENHDLVDAHTRSIPWLEDRSDQNPGMRLFRNHLLAVIAVLLLYCLALVPFWSRVGSWAGTLHPDPGVAPVGAEELAQRFLGLQSDGRPFQVRADGDKLVVEWKIIDARWTELMAKAGLKMLHTVHMQVDASEKAVRALDVSKRVEWRVEAGLSTIRMQWSLSCFRGISFVDTRGGHQYGFSIEGGKPVFDETYSYRFDVDEMKGPLIDIALAAGYRWKPVLSLWRWLGG